MVMDRVYLMRAGESVYEKYTTVMGSEGASLLFYERVTTRQVHSARRRWKSEGSLTGIRTG